MIKPLSSKDSVYFTTDTNAISGSKVIQKALYVYGDLTCGFNGRTATHYYNSGKNVAAQSEWRDSVLYTVSLPHGLNVYDSLGSLIEVYYESVKSIEGGLVDCIDSARAFYPTGELRMLEYYENCDKHGIWLEFDLEGNLIKRTEYKHGLMVLEEIISYE